MTMYDDFVRRVSRCPLFMSTPIGARWGNSFNLSVATLSINVFLHWVSPSVTLQSKIDPILKEINDGLSK